MNLFLEGTHVFHFDSSPCYISLLFTFCKNSLNQHNCRCFIKIISFLRWEVNISVACPLPTLNIIFSYIFKISPIYTMFCICLSGSIKIIILLRILTFFFFNSYIFTSHEYCVDICNSLAFIIRSIIRPLSKIHILTHCSFSGYKLSSVNLFY